MRKQEVDLVEKKVSEELMPEIKKMLPKVIVFLLKTIFPKMEKKILDFVLKISELIIVGRL